MKRTFTIITMVLLTIVSLHSQEQVSSDFTVANSAYSNGDFDQAIELYRQALQVEPSAEAYYNLGNACYRTGEISQSILAYERALRIYPNYKDAKYNLELVRSQIVDNIEDTDAFFLKKCALAIRNLFTEQTWMGISIGTFIIFLIGFIIYVFGHAMTLRKIAFYLAWIGLFIALVSGFSAGSLHSRDTECSQAIITQGIVTVKASPDKSGTEIFTLHEGTKVTITETLGEWCEVHVGNNIGWLQLSNLERI